ncbi:MAG TPA: hypothetical protein DIW50_11910 [Prolixibacteraceae bacterium]|nr:MAG: hypothetical protein A2W89_03995 [Bacteroidetes bacterium GWE2_42_39]HCR91136.1 hypothetical protein [Prolixibacteraceae bacterium]
MNPVKFSQLLGSELIIWIIINQRTVWGLGAKIYPDYFSGKEITVTEKNVQFCFAWFLLLYPWWEYCLSNITSGEKNIFS